MNAQRWREAERMSFDTALKWLKDGCAVQRRSWVPWQFMKISGGYVCMFQREGLSIMKIGEINDLSVRDILAEDWKIVSAADQKPLSTDEPSE
jgi:hypothetical protein